MVVGKSIHSLFLPSLFASLLEAHPPALVSDQGSLGDGLHGELVDLGLVVEVGGERGRNRKGTQNEDSDLVSHCFSFRRGLTIDHVFFAKG